MTPWNGFPEYNRLKECRYGRMLFNQNDQYIGKSLDVYGEFCQGEIELFQQFIKPGQVVIDAGANIGTHTLYLARAVGTEGKVLAFEPQKLIFQTLCANLALNHITNVDALPWAISSRMGVIPIPFLSPLEPLNFGGVSLEATDAETSVKAVALDELLLKQCDFLKMDIEGMELPALQGAVNTIYQHQPILYLENDRLEKSDELIRFLHELHYTLYYHEVPLFSPQNFNRCQQNIFGELVSMNLLGIHRSDSNFVPTLPRIAN